MLRRQKICKFINSPTGCRYGDQCQFIHTLSDTPPSSRGPNNSPGDAPRNTCQFFWTTGACTRGFQCAYRHTQRANAASAQDQAAEVTAADDGDSVIDFFSPEGLAIGAGSLCEDRHYINPSEVHNHLKEFLGDTYHFDSAARIQGFVRVLASVNDKNKSWVRIKFWWKFDDSDNCLKEYGKCSRVSRSRCEGMMFISDSPVYMNPEI